LSEYLRVSRCLFNEPDLLKEAVMRFSIAAVLVFSLTAGAAPALADLITAWNFNSAVPDSNTATGRTTPSSGAGTLSLIGGTTSQFFSGSPGDPAPSDNSGFSTTSYPVQGTNSGTAGVEFAVSTVGFTNISLSFDVRQSANASRNWQLLVSSNGTTFAPPSGGIATFGTVGTGNSSTAFDSTGRYSNDPGLSNQTFVEDVTYTFSPGSAYENNPNFKYRWVSIFSPTITGTYTSADLDVPGAYSTAGTFRFDMVSVMGVVPEPGAFLLGGLICSVIALWKLRQRFIAAPV
jgi:hypothetical protein